MTLWILQICNGNNPQIYGPYESEEKRTEAAKYYKQQSPSDLLCQFNTAEGVRPAVCAYRKEDLA